MAQNDVPDFFGFHPYEFLSDERVLAMDLQQVGAYLLLMISQWINGSIPGDVPTLAKILKQSNEDMERIWAGVGPCFTPHPEAGGRFIQTRLERERVHTLEVMQVERARVKAYRDAKKAKILEAAKTESEAYGVRNADVTVPSTLLSSYIQEENNSKKADNPQFETFWGIYPKKVSKPHAMKAWYAHGKTGDTCRAIIAGLRAQLPALKDQHAKGFCPNPATWLNGERWNDETAPAETAPRLVSTMDPETQRRIEERRRVG